MIFGIYRRIVPSDMRYGTERRGSCVQDMCSTVRKLKKGTPVYEAFMENTRSKSPADADLR